MLATFFKQSYVYRIPCQLNDYILTIYSESYVNQYFHSNQSFFTSLFQNGIFYQLINQLFIFTAFCLSLLTSLWHHSCTENVWKHMIVDLDNNYLRFLSTFLFVTVVIFSLLNLFWGSGFDRETMLLILLVAFILFSFSHLIGKTNQYLSHSVMIRWIQKIYL